MFPDVPLTKIDYCFLSNSIEYDSGDSFLLNLNQIEFHLKPPLIEPVNETVDSYNIKNSSVYCCLLDLSKAFNRLDRCYDRHGFETNCSSKYHRVVSYMMKNTHVTTIFNGFRSQE